MTAADDPRDGHVPGPPYLTTEELRRDVSALREILQARLDGMDRATVVLSETVNRTPTAIQTAISNLRELTEEKLGSLSGQYDEKFRSIQQQFSERDVRGEQAATASASALAAALQAAKEAVFEQAQAAAKAADKTETSTAKQIDLLLAQIKAQGETFSDRLAELKERIDRGEGSTTGAAVFRTERRLDIGQVVAVVAVIVAILSVVLYALKK